MTKFFDTLTAILNTLDVVYTSSTATNQFDITVHEDSGDIKEAELLYNFLAHYSDLGSEICTNYSDALGYGTKFYFVVDGVKINWEWKSVE